MGLLKNYNLKKKEQHLFHMINQKLGQCVRLSTTLIAHAPAAFSAARQVFKDNYGALVADYRLLLQDGIRHLNFFFTTHLVSNKHQFKFYLEHRKTSKEAYLERIGFLRLLCKELFQIFNFF